MSALAGEIPVPPLGDAGRGNAKSPPYPLRAWRHRGACAAGEGNDAWIHGCFGVVVSTSVPSLTAVDGDRGQIEGCDGRVDGQREAGRWAWKSVLALGIDGGCCFFPDPHRSRRVECGVSPHVPLRIFWRKFSAPRHISQQCSLSSVSGVCGDSPACLVLERCFRWKRLLSLWAC